MMLKDSFQFVKSIIPSGSFIVVGTAAAHLHQVSNFRPARDIDLLVSLDTFSWLSKRGQEYKSSFLPCVRRCRLSFKKSTLPTLDIKCFEGQEEALPEIFRTQHETRHIIDGIRTIPLETLISIKKQYGREKDKADIKHLTRVIF